MHRMRIGTAIVLSSLAATTLTSQAFAGPALPQAQDPYFTDAQDRLQESLRLKPNTKLAKNIILFVGDGMGVTTMTVSRIYQGQKARRDGVSNKLVYETLPYGAFSRT